MSNNRTMEFSSRFSLSIHKFKSEFFQRLKLTGLILMGRPLMATVLVSDGVLQKSMISWERDEIPVLMLLASTRASDNLAEHIIYDRKLTLEEAKEAVKSTPQGPALAKQLEKIYKRSK